MMNKYYLSLEKDLQEEKIFYAECLDEKDSEYLRKTSELFLVHAYQHLFEVPECGRTFGDNQDTTRYQQFYLNLAIGLELLLKSIILRKGKKITFNSKKGKNDDSGDSNHENTIPLGKIISTYLEDIFPGLNETMVEDIRVILSLINLRRNNIAHRSKRTHDSYAHEYPFSYLTLYIYDEYYYLCNLELQGILRKSIEKSKLSNDSGYKPFEFIPKSLKKE